MKAILAQKFQKKKLKKASTQWVEEFNFHSFEL
jgi:hypothetical protein